MSIGSSRSTRLACAAIVSVLCMGLAREKADAAERTVLCEEFTDVLCYGCGYAGPALSQLVDVYEESFVFVQYHVNDEYATEWGNERWAWYGGEYTPLASFDGTDLVEGAVSDVALQYNIYRANHLLPDREIPTDVTLNLWVEQVSGPTYRLTAEIGLEPGGQAKTLRLYLVQLLDYYPDPDSYYRNAFRQALPTADVALSPGQTTTVVREITFAPEDWLQPDNIKLVGWVQAPLPAAPAAVYQATQRRWPLISAPADWDGDGVANASDNCPQRYNPDQGDGDADGAGDACDNCQASANPDQADIDEDRAGDACDNCPVLHFVGQNDLDLDTVGDACDACPEVPAPAGVDPFGKSRGCMDLDCDIDEVDAALWYTTLAGPGMPVPSGVDPTLFARADTDVDGDVDLRDLVAVQQNYSGTLVSPSLYIGAAECIACHTANHADWYDTIHRTAFNTLINDGAGENVLCFPCHTVGYGKPSGFVDLETTPHLAGVQCEVCHGPGSNHAADPDNFHLEIVVDSARCGSCHQSCHGLCGENHHPQHEQWLQSKHAFALWTALFDPEFTDECLQCHSTEYRLAPPDHKPTGWDVFFSIECVACHDPHGGPNVGQLRLSPPLLCADCHTMQDAVPPDAEPVQPHAEMLHSTGGFRLNGQPQEGPYSEHWWGLADECKVCHVHEEHGIPGLPVNSGHLFTSNLRACMPCHTEQVATQLVETVREEVTYRLADLARRFDPGDPLYVDPGTLAPGQLEQYQHARFDYEMVLNDQSFGAHNPPYTRKLLSIAEEFFGIPPWELRQPAWRTPGNATAPRRAAEVLP